MRAPTQTSFSCASCGAAASGKFCSTCGAPLGVRCTRCHAQLLSARFCTECGTAAAPTARVTRRRSMILVGAAAAGVTMFTVLAAVPIDQRATPRSTPSGAMNEQAIVSAPDISNMSPRERASRLYDRVMRLHERQKRDSLAFFMPMALAAYGAIPDIDDDGRYDMARLAMIAGELPTARAQRDTILQRNPTHLLGLLLADDLARDATDAKRIEATFVGAVKRERARALPEYSAHAEEIENALKRFRSVAKS